MSLSKFIKIKINLLFIWFGQALAIFGNVFMTFSVGVWIYQKTGSVSQFGLTIMLGYLPELVVSPLAGVLTDRISRKTILLFCSTMQATMYFGLIYFVQDISVNHVYIAITFASVIGGFHRSAYNASLAQLSGSPKSYARVMGIVQLGISLAQMLAPICAGYILYYFSFQSILISALSIFLFSSFSLVYCDFSSCQLIGQGKKSLREDFKTGFKYIVSDKGLFSFLAVHSLSNFARGSVVVLFTPFIISLTTSDVLGNLRSVAGIGMLLGAGIVTMWGGAKNRLNHIYLMLISSGLLMVLIGFSEGVYIIGFSVFCFFALTPVLAALTHSVWQEKTPENIHGRVFSARDTIAGSMFALAYLVMPFLADYLAHFLKSEFNAIGLIFILVGILTVLLSFIAFGNQRTLNLAQLRQSIAG